MNEIENYIQPLVFEEFNKIIEKKPKKRKNFFNPNN